MSMHILSNFNRYLRLSNRCRDDKKIIIIQKYKYFFVRMQHRTTYRNFIHSQPKTVTCL